MGEGSVAPQVFHQPHDPGDARSLIWMRADELATLYRLTDALYRAASLSEIYDAALDAIVGALGTRASILLFDDHDVMRFVAWRGLSDTYRAALEGHSPWKSTDLHAEPIFVEAIEGTDEPDWVKSAIKAEGIAGIAFIPLFVDRRVVGKFMTYYPTPHVFQEHERRLAVTIARQLGFSLERARADDARRVVEQRLRESEERFRVLSEQAPVMIWTSDAKGHCAHLNRLLRSFWGVRETDLREFDWQTSMHPEDRARISQAMFEALTKREDATIEGRYRNAEGEYRVLRTEARPRFSETGEFLGMIGVNIDVTERHEAEAALRESEQRLRVALAAGRMGTWRHDLQTGKEVWDERQFELFGLDPSLEPSPELFLTILHPEDAAKAKIDPSTLEAEDRFRDTEFRVVRPDGRVRWLTAHSLVRYRDGKPAELIGVNFDSTEQKESEARLKLLVDELNHRVKNTLAVVQGIAHQTFKDGRATEDSRRSFEGRLIALATAHNLLTQTNWENASVKELVAGAFRSQGVDDERITLKGPHIDLSARKGLALALALHELCTNALKYGSLSVDAGNVMVEWRQEKPRRLHLTWRETRGPRVEPPARRGFGSNLIERTLARDLDGSVTLRFDGAGVICEIVSPLDAKESG